MNNNTTQPATHTPGPWIREGHDPSPSGSYDSPVISIHECTGQLIAILGYDGQIPTENSVANARLIAAAPKMFAALQRVDTDLSFDDDSHSVYYAINEDDAKAIRAAIADATGASQ